jgi:Cofilin/tropomyosin-type actin-binding protein
VIIEEQSNDPEWDNFRQKLESAESKDKRGKVTKGPRYAVYDFEYELSAGEGKRYVMHQSTYDRFGTFY